MKDALSYMATSWDVSGNTTYLYWVRNQDYVTSVKPTRYREIAKLQVYRDVNGSMAISGYCQGTYPDGIDSDVLEKAKVSLSS